MTIAVEAAEGDSNKQIDEKVLFNKMPLIIIIQESDKSVDTCVSATATFGINTGSFKVERTKTLPSLPKEEEEEEGKMSFLIQVWKIS